MATSAEIQTQLDAAKTNLSQYTKDLPNEIKNQIDAAWNPILQKTAGETAKLKASFLPSFFGAAMTGPGMGTSEADLSPTQKLTSVGRTLGSFAGDIGKSQGVSDYLGGQMKDLYQSALDSMKFGQGTAQQNYQNLFGEYTLAKQLEGAAKARAAAYAAQQQQKVAWPGQDTTYDSPTYNPYFDPKNFAKPPVSSGGWSPMNALLNAAKSVQQLPNFAPQQSKNTFQLPK